MSQQVAFLVAHKNFRDEEYFLPREVLEAEDFLVKSFSDKEGVAQGAQGGEVETKHYQSISSEDFQAIILIGGPGAPKYLDTDSVYQLVKKFNDDNKLIAAICISPTILAKAGLLEGKEATVWTSEMDKSAIDVLEHNGAQYLSESVVKDGRIITADGPQSAKVFGRALVKALKS